MSHLAQWAREALAQMLRQTAVKLVAQRERERVEAERWLRKLQQQARAREQDKPPT